jgi:uncharacterized cupin superfamily protein
MEPINESDREWTELEQGDTKLRRNQLGDAAGNEQLGCSLYELPAGCQSWQYYYHTANEEAIYMLSGTGTLRLDGDTHSLREGDYVPFLSNESGGHRVINDSDAPLRYLTLSTMQEPDVTVYPEMNKLGVFVGGAPGDRGDRSLHGYYNIDTNVDYWEHD